MTVGSLTRRNFLAHSGQSLNAGWLSFQLPWIAILAGCARDDASGGAPFLHLTAAEARTMRAFAARIIPSADGTPGADELDVVYFVDRALGTPYFAPSLLLLRAGLSELDARARAIGEGKSFAELSAARQVDIMRRVEGDPFFIAARTLVVIAVFSDPSHSGNKGADGWRSGAIDRAA